MACLLEAENGLCAKSVYSCAQGYRKYDGRLLAHRSWHPDLMYREQPNLQAVCCNTAARKICTLSAL